MPALLVVALSLLPSALCLVTLASGDTVQTSDISATGNIRSKVKEKGDTNPYVVADHGSSCPTGKTPIQDAATCAKACDALGLSWLPNTQTLATFPDGCVLDSTTIFFNSASSTSSTSSTSCKKVCQPQAFLLEISSDGDTAQTSAISATGIIRSQVKEEDKLPAGTGYAVGEDCAGKTPIQDAATCEKAPWALGLTWLPNTQNLANYPDGCVFDTTSIFFNSNADWDSSSVNAAGQSVCQTQASLLEISSEGETRST